MLPRDIARRIEAEQPTFSEPMKRVGTFVLDHPEDVALLSMREQARRLAVPPATMTRFAQRLGYSGYDEFRRLFAAHMRSRVSDLVAWNGAAKSRPSVEPAAKPRGATHILHRKIGPGLPIAV